MIVSKTVEAFVDVDVDVSLSDFDLDDIIEYVERQGYSVLDKDDSGGMSQAAEDVVYDLYRDWLSMSNKEFEKRLKAFFEDTTGKLVV